MNKAICSICHSELIKHPDPPAAVNPWFCPCWEKNASEEHSGGSVSYYVVEVKHPIHRDPYTAECMDIMEALELTSHEANIFKCIWRRAAERQGKKKKGNNALYDAEKMAFFANRILQLEKLK